MKIKRDFIEWSNSLSYDRSRLENDIDLLNRVCFDLSLLLYRIQEKTGIKSKKKNDEIINCLISSKEHLENISSELFNLHLREALPKHQERAKKKKRIEENS